MFNTRDKMKAFAIRPVKSLGQNFLTDCGVVEQILDTAELTEQDLVVEIGPGLGIMTEAMAERAGFVVAVEIDRHLMEPLGVIAALHDNIAIINNDILKVDIRREIVEPYFTGKGFTGIKVVANLPYYITTPIIMSLLELSLPEIRQMVFMVQKEVGQRMTAIPGGKEYGALSVAVKYFSESEIAFIVPPHCFVPQPAVDSCVVSLRVRSEDPFYLEDKGYFFKVVKAAFGQRRKMLTNALANASYLDVSREQILEALSAMGKDEKIRGETLSAEEFGELSNRLRKN